MALNPNIALQGQPLNVQQAIAGGLQNADTIRNRAVRDAILKNQSNLGSQELITGQQRQTINQQAINQNQVAAEQEQARQAVNQAGQMYKGLIKVRELGLADRPAALARLAKIASENPSLGIDPQRVLSIDLSDNGLDSNLAALSSFVTDTSKSVKQKEFESLVVTGQLSPEDIKKAARIDLGLDPRAVGSGAKVTDIDGTPTIVDPTQGTAKEINVTRTTEGGQVTAPVTLESTATGKATVAARTDAHKAAVAKSEKFFDSLPSMNEKMSVYGDIIQAVNDGANTGKISNMFPSLTKATLELDNLQKRLGLNVIQNTTFGSLSGPELAFALDAALPKDLVGKDLVSWVKNKKRVQQKLITYANEAAAYLGTGENTIAGWLELQKSKVAGGSGMSSQEADDILGGFN